MNEKERLSALQGIMATSFDRRSALKTAAAAGLIPVLTTGTLAARAAAQDATPKQGGTLVILGQDSIESLSPEDTGETVQWVPTANIFEGLYMVNEVYELEPVLADSYEPSEDGLVYTFKLKTGVTFHNGDPFTSADVIYTYNWIMDEANASTRLSNFDLVETVEAPDDTTIVVTLKEADVTFMINVATVFIYPATYHAEIGENDFKVAPVGTGPFKFGEMNPQQRVRLDAWENYYRGRANLDSFQMDVVPEAAGRMAALETGQADNSMWGLNAEDNLKLKDSGNFTIFETQQVATNHFPLNNTHPFLQEKEVRQALLWALDRQSFADDVFLGQATVATSNLSPAVAAFYNPDVPLYEFNPEKSKELLEGAGWVEGSDGIREKDGVKAAFTMMVFQGDTQRRPEAEVAQQWWKDIGVDCQLQEGITSEILGGLRAGEYDAGLFNWVYGGSNGDPDSRDTLVTGGANNFFQYSNAEVDDLMNNGIKELDPVKRADMYKRIQAIIAEEVPFLFLLNLMTTAFYNKRVKGLPETVLVTDNVYPKAYQYWIDEEA
ncbi:MAG: ABC transporter substrate-binding protein [Thermomicrobiales bacterium]|nr:ABC transporter substrate-binding protein [Thermomicrobiales bacterium]MCO5229437.1 ABC transporter substrate-binding protein [Thermomicrobiales bacterium]